MMLMKVGSTKHGDLLNLALFRARRVCLHHQALVKVQVLLQARVQCQAQHRWRSMYKVSDLLKTVLISFIERFIVAQPAEDRQVPVLDVTPIEYPVSREGIIHQKNDSAY